MPTFCLCTGHETAILQLKEEKEAAIQNVKKFVRLFVSMALI